MPREGVTDRFYREPPPRPEGGLNNPVPEDGWRHPYADVHVVRSTAKGLSRLESAIEVCERCVVVEGDGDAVQLFYIDLSTDRSNAASDDGTEVLSTFVRVRVE